MTTILPDVLFYLFSLLAIGAAGMILVQRSPMSCAISLVVSVLSIALLYFLLSAHFVAVAQMIVYAGAIVVLFIFVIMLLNLSDREIDDVKITFFKIIGGFVALATLVMASRNVRGTIPIPEAANELSSAYGSTQEIGRLLFGEYVLAFEMTGVLVLAAMVAGVVLAKREVSPKRMFSFIDWAIGLLNKDK